MAPRRSGFVVPFVLVLTAGAASPEEPPAFGTGVHLVALDLVARDRKGNAIRDLRSDEVEVYEDGVRQSVTEFRAVPLGREALVDGPAVFAPESVPALRPVPGPAVLARPRGRVNLVALVFDQLSVEGRRLASKAARDLIDAQLAPDAFVAVFRIDGRLMLVEGFTRERASLLESIDGATLGNAPAFVSGVQGMGGEVSGSRNGGDPMQRGYDPRELRPAHSAGDPEAGTPMDGDGPLTAERKMANVTLNILRTAEEVERTLRGNRSLDGLLAVVHGLRDLPGRKTLVYFSEGLQVPPWLEDPFRALASEANRASVSIYSVDVRGLRVAGHMDDAHALLDQAVMVSQSQRLSGGAWHGVTREQARQFETVETTLRMNAQGTLDDLSKATGGFLIGDSNDLALGLHKLGEDTRHYYEVAYAPGDPRYDGRFHRVSVKVKRPGASVQSREGYFAIPHAVGEPVYGYEGPLLSALAARRRPQAFDHQSAVFRFEADAGRVQHALVVAAPLARVTFRRDEGAGLYLGRVSVLALVKSESGDIVEKLGQDYVIEGRLADLDATRKRRVSLVRRFALPPGRYSVETAVRDGLADRTGCSATRLVVAPAGPGVRLSSVVGLAGAMPAMGEDRDDPFRVGQVRMTPDLGGRLRAEAGSDGLAVYYVVYVQPGAKEAPRMTLEVDRAGRVVRRGEVALPAADAGGRIPYVAKVPVAALAPGEYTLRLSVTQGTSTATEEAFLQVARASVR
jgi:VWFA-related protein